MSRTIPKTTAYYEIGTSGVVRVKLEERKYSGGLASLLGISFQEEAPQGKTVTRARSTQEARIDGKLVPITLIYRNGAKTQATQVLCSPKQADNALDNQAQAIRSLKWNGKDIIDAYPSG